MVTLATLNRRSWIIFSAIVFVSSTVAYVALMRPIPSGPRGGTIPGLAFGGLALACMLFAVVLSLRKRYRTFPVGNATFWLVGHIWVGVLTVPLVLFHTDFQIGHGLARVLMILFGVCVASGVYGLVLQQFLPSLMKKTVPNETIYEIIDDRIEGLCEEADETVEAVCAGLEDPLEPRPYLEFISGPNEGYTLIFEPKGRFVFGKTLSPVLNHVSPSLPEERFAIEGDGESFEIHNLVSDPAVAHNGLLIDDQAVLTSELKNGTRIQLSDETLRFRFEPPEGGATLKTVYLQKIRGFLSTNPDRRSLRRFRNEEDITNCFDHYRKFLPPGTYHEILNDLSSICLERLELAKQARLHRWLHGWLVVHAPVSVMLVVLSVVHGLIALLY